MINPVLSHIKIEISFCLDKNTISSACRWGDIWRKDRVSPFISVGSAPTFSVQEIVPLLWYGPALRKSRFGGEGAHSSLLSMGFLRSPQQMRSLVCGWKSVVGDFRVIIKLFGVFHIKVRQHFTLPMCVGHLRKNEWFGSKKESVWCLKVSLVILLLEVIASGSNTLYCRQSHSILADWGASQCYSNPQERCKGRHKEPHKDLWV